MPPQHDEALASLTATTNENESPAPKTPQLATTSPFSSFFTSGSVTATCSVIEFGKSHHATGICFLDHMVDQLTSHAQLGVTMRVSTLDGVSHQPHTDYAGGSLTDRPHDEDIFAACGAALGGALQHLVRGRSDSVFCCPLDEAFAEARLTLSAHAPSSLCELAPYGTMPRRGRRWIGCYRCALTPVFFEHLVRTLGASLELRKMRGHNAHHIVESSFKAFARVFRACLDGVTMGGSHGCVLAGEKRVRGVPVVVPNHRVGSRSRSTKETTIEVHVDLDSPAPAALTDSIYTGVELMDRVLGELRHAAGFHFHVHCDGDIYIDDHHTVEDVAITMGQCLNVALGDKAGLARMGCAEATSNAATVRCVVDLSNRPYFEWDLPLDEEYVGGDEEGFAAMRRGGEHGTMLCGSALTCEMLQHVFESLTIEMRATVHIEVLGDHNGEGHTKDLAIASARAYGTALRECVRVDARRAGKVASSKGTLSV